MLKECAVKRKEISPQDLDSIDEREERRMKNECNHDRDDSTDARDVCDGTVQWMQADSTVHAVTGLRELHTAVSLTRLLRLSSETDSLSNATQQTN